MIVLRPRIHQMRMAEIIHDSPAIGCNGRGEATPATDLVGDLVGLLQIVLWPTVAMDTASALHLDADFAAHEMHHMSYYITAKQLMSSPYAKDHKVSG
ncbi:hypothetical protein HPP92_004424 [Vanilla planifolia]|uniref:Uncharacterized protein n=1 Tax=Vanilla planifolia TaxID=51239 RepID=A0A835RJG3_VANPL|nr:hypothetical protein HPP92_004424 [Vanilla planifolia]